MDKTAFDIFWQAYPKKRGKGEAVRVWDKLRPDVALQAKIIDAVETQSNHKDWKKDDGRFIPYPATWLNQGRWDDVVGVKAPAPPAVKCMVTDCTYKATSNISSHGGLSLCPDHRGRQYAKDRVEAIRKDG